MFNAEKLHRRMLFRKLTGALLIFLTVFLIVELFSRWISTTSTAPFGNNIRDDQKVLISDVVGGGIVAIGDSIIARDFYPELFSSLLSNKLSITYPVYNLGVEGANLSWQKATFNHLVKKNIIPSVVILNISIHALNVYALDSSNSLTFEDAKPTDQNSLDYYTRCTIHDDGNLSSKIYCSLAKNIYFFRLLPYYHTEMNSWEKILINPENVRYTNLILKYPAVSNMGFSPNFGVLTQESITTEFMRNAMMNTYKDDFAHFKFGTNRLDDIINTFNNHSVKVILVLMPVYQPLMREVYNKYALPKNDLIIKNLEQYSLQKGVAFVNLFEAAQDPMNFQDPVHLNIVGACKITQLLAHKILAKQYTCPKGYLDQEIYKYANKDLGKKS